MATDLREPQHTVGGADHVRPRGTGRDLTWPFVATAIALIVLTGVSLLLLTQEAPRPSTSMAQWIANVDGMATGTRESGGFPQPVEPVGSGVDAGSYAKGARTSVREATSTGSSVEDPPDLMTEVREG